MTQESRAFDFVGGELLLIDKPLDWTSFDVVNFIRSFLRKMYNLKKLKVGHAGTLDPLATGLLIICTGKMTKRIDTYQGMEKTYTGSMILGASTPSHDGETDIDKSFDISHITHDQLHKNCDQFIGDIEQVPPLYSAIKIKGKRAYEYARKNDPLKLQPRKLHITEFSLEKIDLPTIDFKVRCSKGTYIRSLVRDFGVALDNGATLSGLKRTMIGEYSLDQAVTLEVFKKAVLDQVTANKGDSLSKLD